MTDTINTNGKGQTVYLETYGCQMNEYDTEIVRAILVRNQFDFTETPEAAGIILINTCSVRENAHQRVHARISTLKQLKKKRADLIIGVLGCMAQNLKKALLEDKSGIDLIVGPDNYKALPVIINRVRETGEKEFALSLSEYEDYADVFPTSRHGVNAWLAVMRGCDNYCTFCVVPYVRGHERSRDPQNVIEETRQLAAQGFKQVTLLGQNVNSYSFDGLDFASLITAVSQIDGIKRIRFTSPHPKDFPEALIYVVRDNPKACKHIHLPLQAGSTRYSRSDESDIHARGICRARAAVAKTIPGLALTTDIIVGFPTETEGEYQETLEVMREVEFDAAFMFAYSERKGTPAAKRYPDDISDETKSKRMVQLVEQQRQISYQRNQAHLGQVFEVMVEGPAKKRGQLMGRNDGNKIVVFSDTVAQPGDLVNVKINEVTPNTLIGELVT